MKENNMIEFSTNKEETEKNSLNYNYFIGKWNFVKIISNQYNTINGYCDCYYNDKGSITFKEIGTSHNCYQEYVYEIKEKYFNVYKTSDNILLHHFNIDSMTQ